MIGAGGGGVDGECGPECGGECRPDGASEVSVVVVMSAGRRGQAERGECGGGGGECGVG